VLRILNTLAWLACVVYSTIPAFWLVIHPFANFWRGQKRNPYKFLVPLWIALWIAVALATAPWRYHRLYSHPVTWLPAAALLATGIGIYRRASAGFSWSQLSGLPEIYESISQQRPLATTGIRVHVRHPIYLGHLCEMLAWSAGSGLAVCYGLTALAIVTGAAMIAMEDRELEQRFGPGYQHYKESVPAIFPRKTPYNPNQGKAGN
jgi:protein-S-isoprenylcysteine O-methyltransferase Ste14